MPLGVAPPADRGRDGRASLSRTFTAVIEQFNA
jgi:hypothetical protein